MFRVSEIYCNLFAVKRMSVFCFREDIFKVNLKF